MRKHHFGAYDSSLGYSETSGSFWANSPYGYNITGSHLANSPVEYSPFNDSYQPLGRSAAEIAMLQKQALLQQRVMRQGDEAALQRELERHAKDSMQSQIAALKRENAQWRQKTERAQEDLRQQKWAIEGEVLRVKIKASEPEKPRCPQPYVSPLFRDTRTWRFDSPFKQWRERKVHRMIPRE